MILCGILLLTGAVVLSQDESTSDTPTQIPIAFTQERLDISPNFYTSLVISPDNRLYAGTIMGQIVHWRINDDGTLDDEQVIDLYEERIIIGIVFDPESTPDNPILWITHNWGSLTDAPNFTGAIDRLTVTDYGTEDAEWTAQPVIIELPRSVRDHLSNSLAFGPDGAMYLIQGSTSAMGDRDAGWALRPETLLSAAVLRIDTVALLERDDLPLSVRTGILNDDGTLDDDMNFGLGDPRLAENDLYDPLAPDAPVTIYATGFRNAYDLLWHSNGELYVPVNGSAQGGNAPGTPDDLPIQCQNRIDSAFNGAYSFPSVPSARNIDVQPDILTRVVQNGYYGHPNPMRCEWVAHGGNPTADADPGQFGNHYSIGLQPDRNYRGISYVFNFNASANGVIEYHSDTFGGALRGSLLIVRYSVGQDIIILHPGSPNMDIVGVQEDVPGFTELGSPLDLVEDTRSGNIYVNSTTESTIILLRPDESGEPIPVVQPTLTIVRFNRTWFYLMVAGTVVFGVWSLFSLWMLWRRRKAGQPLRELFIICALVGVIIAGFVGFIGFEHKFGNDVFSREVIESSAAAAADQPVTDNGQSENIGDLTPIERGEILYQQTCAPCHAENAGGVTGLGPGLVNNAFMNGLDDDGLVAFIIEGRDVLHPDNTTNVAMPPRGGNPSLTDEDLHDIVAYLRGLE